MYSFQSESAERLFEAILLLKDKEECRRFFEDICTISETQDLAQRFSTALLLDEGASYQKISEQTGVSTATISRVSRCLNYGSGGYRTVIDRMKEKKGTQ